MKLDLPPFRSGVGREVAGGVASNGDAGGLGRKSPAGAGLFGQDELVTVSHTQAVKTAAVLDQNFPRLAEQFFGAQ